MEARSGFRAKTDRASWCGEAAPCVPFSPCASRSSSTLSDIFIDYAGGSTREQGERVVEEFEKDYPEPYRFGIMPAWGLRARHVENFALDRVEFRATTPDFRPAVVLDDVRDVRLDRAKTTPSAGTPVVRLAAVREIDVHHSAGLPEGRRDAVTAESW